MLVPPTAVVGLLGMMWTGTVALAAPPTAEARQLELAAQAAAAQVAPTLEKEPGAGVATPVLLARDFKVAATLEEQLVALDDIADHQGLATLRPSGRRVCLLAHKAGLQSAVFMRKHGQAWTVGQVHGSALGKPLGGALAALQKTRVADDGQFFLVNVPALDLLMLGHRERGVLMLTPIEDRPDLNLTANQPQPATRLFASISRRG